MLTVESIERSVQVFWRDTFPPVAVTVYPGQHIDGGAITEWVELWLDVWDERIRRAGARAGLTLFITVHCFSRDVTQTARLHQIADAVRETLASKTIIVRDFSLSGTPTVGHVRVGEPELRVLTRGRMNAAEDPLRQISASFRALVEEAT